MILILQGYFQSVPLFRAISGARPRRFLGGFREHHMGYLKRYGTNLKQEAYFCFLTTGTGVETQTKGLPAKNSFSPPEHSLHVYYLTTPGPYGCVFH